jgi:predicted RNA-binding Zn ribbon-like protein
MPETLMAAPAPSLCLDFVNTRYWCGTPQPSDALGDVEALRLVAAAPPRRELVWTPRQAGWRVPQRSPGVAALLAPVWWSAADLVLAADRLRLRCCANPHCGWLFLDDSKAGTRRWCSMSACGNRAKVQRHAQRQRSLKAPARPAGTR